MIALCALYGSPHIRCFIFRQATGTMFKHAFAEQRLDYQLINMLNAYGSMTFTLKAQSLFFYGFKTFVKVQLINGYADGCHDTYCKTCHIIAHHHNIGVR